MTYLVGLSRSGKSVYLARCIEAAQRVVIWDPKGQYVRKFAHKAIARVTNRNEMARLVFNNRGPLWLAFVSSDPKEFDAFCALAFHAGKLAPCAVVAEELAMVTSAGKAHGEWGRLLNQGLEYGIDIYATVQRVKEGDKTIFNNISKMILFRQLSDADKSYLVSNIGIPETAIPSEPLRFTTWWPDGRTRPGVLKFHTNQSDKYL